MTWVSSADPDHPWKDSEGNVQSVEINSRKSFNSVLRNPDMITISLNQKITGHMKVALLIYSTFIMYIFIV